MKKKLLALLCVVALLCTFMPSAFAADQLYFVAVNDKMLEYSPDTQPIKSRGTMYVPYTVFLSEFNGGVNLGVFYGRDKQRNTLSFYAKQTPTLTFDYGAGITYDTTDTVFNFRAIVRNGTVYLPAWAVSDYFGLECTYSATEFGDLVRIKRADDYYLSDQFFLSSATDKFREQRKQFDRDQLGEPVVPTPVPTPSPVPTTPDGQRQVSVCFAFRCDSGMGPSDLLDLLGTYGQTALFLFHPDDLARWDDHIRRLLAEGHRVGLIVNGETAEECVAQAEQGNRLLGHIARTTTDFLLVEGSDPLRQELSLLGWACWNGNVDGIPAQGVRSTTLSSNLLNRIESRRSYARVLMNDSTTASQALSLLLPKLRGGAYLLKQVTEGEL